MDVIPVGRGVHTTHPVTLNSSARRLSVYPGPTLKSLEDKLLWSSPPPPFADETLGEDK